MDVPYAYAPLVSPTKVLYGPREASKSGDGTSWHRNFYHRRRRRISRLDGSVLTISPAAIVMLSDEARGLPCHYDEYVIYDNHARLKKLKGYVRRTIVG